MSDYYNNNAQQFYDETVSVNMQPLYDAFMPLISTGAGILDAGCGSGRDSKYFHEQGFDVTAFDASQALVDLAAEYSGLPVICADFMSLQLVDKSQAGIWACASLLHVPFNDLPSTFAHLSRFLQTQGIFYCSFKYGDNEVIRNGRQFTDVNESRLQQVLSGSQLSIKKTWITSDLRKGRESEKWLNALLVKGSDQ